MAVKVKKSTGNENLVVNQIIIKTPQRTTSDVGAWRTALQSADKGKVKALYDLFDDLLIDGVLSDAIDKRIDAVKLSELTFHDENGEEVEEIISMIDSPGFESLLGEIMWKIFKGRAGGEFDFNVEIENSFNFEPIPTKYIRPENKMILINDTDETGIDYSIDDHLLIVGKPRDFGLLLKAAPYAIWKRGGFGDWAEWLEVFGMPKRVFKYSATDPATKQLLEDAAEKAGSAPWIVIPKEADVTESSDGANGSSNTSYNDFRKACNEEMLITILGQTMTTLDGSSRSQSEVHMEVQQDKTKADMKYVGRILNYIVKPILESRGFPVGGGTFIFPEAPDSLTVDDIVSLSDIVDIPAYFIFEKFGIPEAQDGEPIARRNMPGVEQISRVAGDPTPQPDGNIQQSDRNFFKQLLDFFASAPGSGATSKFHTPPQLPEWGVKLSDESLSDRIINAAIEGETFYPDLFAFISLNLITALDAKPTRLSDSGAVIELVEMADLGFTYKHQNDAFRTAQELNIFHFSAAKTVAELQTLNGLYRKSKSFDDFYKSAVEKVDVFNKTWQKTEWQSATLISESTANYNRLKSKTHLFPYWKYVAVIDERTRPEHAALNGLILAANDPRWAQIWPPNGWKCRCYVVGVMAHEVSSVDLKAMRAKADAYIKGPEFKAAKAQGFGVNRALTPQLFNANQLYIKKFPTMAKRLLKNVNYNTYKLGSFEANRKKAATAVAKYQGTIEDYVNGLKKEDGKTFFTDYNDRKIEFSLKRYLKGHSTKLQERVPYIKSASETLKVPDEVWINAAGSDTFDQYVFIKYNTDETMVVVAKIKGGNLYEVKTWFSVQEGRETMDRYRQGLLIKKPGKMPG
jgi:SPP1 gp7 family putative phage head morphogenesis protein